MKIGVIWVCVPQLIEETKQDKNVCIFTSAERPSKCLRPLPEPIGTAVQQDQSMRFGRAAWKRAGSMGNWFSVLYLQKCQLSSKSHSVEEWVCIVCSSQKASGEARGDRWQNRKERKPCTRATYKRLKTHHPGLSPFFYLLLSLVFTFVYVAEFSVLTSTDCNFQCKGITD